MIKKILLFALLFSSIFVNAQNEIEMADQFRAEGKIYVVITVLLLIFFAIVGFLIYLERKIKRLENKK